MVGATSARVPPTADLTAKLLALRPERLDECQVPALLQRGGETLAGGYWQFTSRLTGDWAEP